MAFTAAEKVDIRRFCGFQAYGNITTQAFAHRYSTHYGLLEFRMNNYSADEEAVIRTVYLANLTTLETAIVGTSANLDTDQAAVWHHNKHEQRDREALFASWRRKLCQFIGIACGPGLPASSGMTLVV